MNIQLDINKLLHYGLKYGMIHPEDVHYTANKIIHLLKLDEFEAMVVSEEDDFYQLIDRITEYAYGQGVISSLSTVHRDLFSSELMDLLMPRPSEVNLVFWDLYQVSPKEAMDYFYQLSQKSNYIRLDRINQNIIWKSQTNAGEMDLTINLSKPEKDPKLIAEALALPKTSYPKCPLCRENEGYYGRINHPDRTNHRLITLEINNEPWFFQYSPYSYYNEHSILLSKDHRPMKISKDTFKGLLDFVSQFPHYFIGSNADLPIVGGSILSHDHFQAGQYEFAMMKQDNKMVLDFPKHPDVEVGIVDWPMSVLRLRSQSIDSLVELGDEILTSWRVYSDEAADILAHTEDPHNTITPIARFTDGAYELYLVLRNNRTTEEFPLGIFHPHEEHHHLKKENIGLIEVMGLAVLPARLKDELEGVKAVLLNKGTIADYEGIEKHQDWIFELSEKYPSMEENDVDAILEKEIGYKFESILSHCAVFEEETSFIRFIDQL